MIRPYYKCPVHGLFAALSEEMLPHKIYAKSVVEAGGKTFLFPGEARAMIYTDTSAECSSFVCEIQDIYHSGAPCESSCRNWLHKLAEKWCVKAQKAFDRAGIETRFLNPDGSPTSIGIRWVKQERRKCVLPDIGSTLSQWQGEAARVTMPLSSGLFRSRLPVG